jgi:hypothetical protein
MTNKILLPLATHQFRVDAKGLDTIIDNTEKVQFDFVNKTITINVRQTLDPLSLQEAIEFGSGLFDIEAGPVGSTAFGIRPINCHLLSHTLNLSYADKVSSAMHIFVFGYDALITGLPETEEAAPLPSDPRFPTPQEAIESLSKKAANS